MSRGYEEDLMLDPRNIGKIFQKNLLRKSESYVDEIERATQQDSELRSERSSLSRAFSLFRSLVTKHSSSLQALQEITIDDLQRYITSRSTMNRVMILIARLDSSASSSSTSSSNNIRKAGSVAPPSSSVLPPHSSSTTGRAVGRPNSLLNVKDSQQSSLSSNYMHPSFARNISIQSEDNYYDDDFEEFNPDLDIAEEVSEDEDEEEKQKKFFAEVMNDTHELTYIAATDNRKSSFVDRLRESQHNSTAPTTSSSQTIIQPKKVNSSISHEDLPPSSRNYYSSRDPQHISSLDSADQDHPARVSTAMTSASTTGAFSRVGTADPNQQPKKRQKNPTWISKRQWRLGEKIGSGSFGEVFQAMNDKGKLFAAKRMNVIDKSLEVDNLLGEIQLMRGLSHKHIVEYLGAFVDTEACYLYIFQEWVPGGSVAHLLKKFGPFSPSVVKNYTRQILLGLQYLHTNGIIHRDIKGGNILVDDGGTVKLADFGASTKLSAFDKTQETTTIKGTPYFMAPEVLAASRYGRKGDIWAVGCTMIQMLTGEPPWKDRNLKGLIQLHLLLSSWNQGPPPYNCELSPDGRHCLEMCFRKDENERPSAVELLQCTFLRDDDLEDSHNGSFNNSFRSGNNSTFPSQRDLLEDSGVLTGLKQEINKAVTRSMAGLPTHQTNAVEDTMQMIDRKIAEKQQQQQIPPPNNSNPFASRPSNEATPRTTESIQHLLDRLPSGNNYNSNDSGPAISGPKFSRDVPIPTPLSLQQVSNSANNSTGTTPYSSNPYKKGNIAIKNNQPQSNNPFGRDYIANNSSSSRSDEGENRATSLSNLMSPNNHLPVNPVTTPIPVRSNATTPSGAANTPVRDSLHAIKRRANEKAQGIPGSNLLRRPGTSSNQSSNRDTEELTPLPVDDDVNPDDEINILPSGRGSSSNPFGSNSRDEAKRSFYDTRYYEEKQRDGNPFQKNNTPSSLIAPSRSNAASPSFVADEAKEDYSPFSSSSNNVSRKSELEREVSVESVADEVGDNYYTRDMNSSNDEVPVRVNKNPFSSNTVEDIKVMSSLKTSQSIDGAGRKYYYPTKHLEENQSDVTSKPNIHQAIMKKSASASDGVKTSSNRVSPVPRLTALENPSNDVLSNLAPSRALREQARRNSNKYSSSESARILRPEPVVDPITRPASSNASFTYQDKGSRNVSAAASPSTLRVEGSKPRGSLGSNSNLHTLASGNVTKSSSASVNDSRASWKCGRCNSLNIPNIDYCERCSTRRGVSGDRKADAVVPRF